MRPSSNSVNMAGGSWKNGPPQKGSDEPNLESNENFEVNQLFANFSGVYESKQHEKKHRAEFRLF